jgi:hypothetical protein
MVMRKLTNKVQTRRYFYSLLFIFALACAMRPDNAMPADTTAAAEPIFSIWYNPHTVHFDSLYTRELLPSCRTFLSDLEPLPTTLTLYAEYESGSTRMYIVGRDDNLKIAVIRDGECSGGVPILAILQRHHSPPSPRDPVLSKDEIVGLFSDALGRYTKAFGGKNNFFQWLDSLTDEMRSGCKGQPEIMCPPTYHILPPELQQMLNDYRKE